MDTGRKDLLNELAADASLERSDFLAQASAQLRRFLDANAGRIAALGGLVLIDDDVDYLAVAADLTFRSRSRYQDEATGKWLSETEIIENPSELVELYNPADVFAAFTEAEAGAEDEEAPADEAAEEASAAGGSLYAAAADDWAAGQDFEEAPESEEDAAERLYDLAMAFQERSQQTEAHLLEQFETAASPLTSVLGDLIIADDDDERLTLKASGSFAAEVIPESDAERGEWRKLDGPDAIVEFYDPTDIFGDLADTLADSFPEIAGSDGAAASEDVEVGEEAETEPDGEGSSDEEDGKPR
jgi:hypothetical protein